VHGYALSVIACGIVIAFLYWARIVFITASFAVIIALILEPFVGLIMRLRAPRPLASMAVCLVALLLVYLTGLATYNQVASLAAEVPRIEERIASIIDTVSGRITTAESEVGRVFNPSRKQPAPPPPPVAQPKSRKKGVSPQPAEPLPNAIQEVRIHEDRNPVADYLVASLGTVYQFVLMASFVPFLVYFMLSWRDHIYRSFLRFFEGPDRLIAARSLQGISAMARAFVVGNFVTGALTSACTVSLLALVHLPYPFLAGMASGFLTIVPYVGMPVALLPPLLAGLAAGAPSSILLLAAGVVVVLHLVAMNVFYPTLVGGRVHLNPLVVTFSLMFWGFLWDAAGLLLAIPLTAGLKAVCDNVDGLKAYGRFLGD
jgi:predicted PurR-regulated permease PerM